MILLRSGLWAAVSLGSRPARSLGSVAMSTSCAPSVADLAAALAATATGKRLLAEEAERARGLGVPHTDAKLRLFGKAASDVRVTLYRDTAAWCPYCQKVWLLLEEKRVPYKVVKINMRSYGDKPPEYLRKVPNGLLPALEIDGSPLRPLTAGSTLPRSRAARRCSPRRAPPLPHRPVHDGLAADHGDDRRRVCEPRPSDGAGTWLGRARKGRRTLAP